MIPGRDLTTMNLPAHMEIMTLCLMEPMDPKAEKKKILDTTIARLEEVLPGISSQVETSDVATPITMFRYTNNWKGALGFMMTEDIAEEMVMRTEYTLPGLDDFYMIGQWVKGLGTPMAAASGKEVIRKICKSDRRKFKAE